MKGLERCEHCACAHLVTSVTSDSWQPYGLCLPGSSVHRILQARMPQRVAMSSSRGSSRPRDRARVLCVSCTAGRFFTTEPLGKPKYCISVSYFHCILVSGDNVRNK